MTQRRRKKDQSPCRVQAGAVSILALDCATRTGWAWGQRGDDATVGWWRVVESGVEDFSVRRGESSGARFMRFRVWLRDTLRVAQPDLVLYEQAHHRGGAATALCVGMTTRVEELAEAHSAAYAAVHSATLKKHATGSGRAEKGALVAIARGLLGRDPVDDNEADAVCLLAYGFEAFA